MHKFVFTCTCLSWICRDIERVLREDRDKLLQLQKKQPHFSEQQKKELVEVHSWIKKGSLPEAIDNKVEERHRVLQGGRNLRFSEETFIRSASWSVQECSCCDGTLEAAVAENQPDADIADAETWSDGCQRRHREGPANAAVICCDATSAPSNTQTPAARP